MPRTQFCKSSVFAYTNASKEFFSPLTTLSEPWLLVIESVQFSRDEQFLQDLNAQKRRANNVQNGRKSVQKSAKKCKQAQIQKTLPLKAKGLLTHVYARVSEHPYTICREKCNTTARNEPVMRRFFKNEHFFFHERKPAF